MCFSAMAEQNAKKLSRMFGATVNVDSYASLFQRRLDGERLSVNKAMELPFLNEAKSMVEKSIAKNIRAWHLNEIRASKAEIEKQTARFESAKAKLAKKETATALKDLRISENKISKANYDIKRHESEKIISEFEERIFPQQYVSILCLNEENEKTIMPMRYHMRPHDRDESFDREYFGCYNARYDSLTKVDFWRDSLQKRRRGILVAHKFYENVEVKDYLRKLKLPKNIAKEVNEEQKEKIVVRFEPKDQSVMYIPVLWDCWKKRGSEALYSVALITDDPPPEVADAGHNRCPIFLDKAAIDDWLTADLETGKEIKEQILSRRQTPYYAHEVLGAA